MNLENGFTATNVWQVDRDLPVKPPRTKQRWIENIRTVRGGDNDNALLSVEAVHFDQQSVKRLLTFIVATAQAMSAAAPDRIDFVNKDQAGRVFARLLEHVPHAAGSHTDKHLDKIR